YDDEGPLPCQQALIDAGCPQQTMKAIADNGDGTGVFGAHCWTADFTAINAAIVSDDCQGGGARYEFAYQPIGQTYCLQAPPQYQFWIGYDPPCPGGGCYSR